MENAWFLEVLDADGRVLSRLRLDRAVTVGRALTCDLVLDDPAVSPDHLAVEPEGGGWVVRDRESLNGLYRLGPPRRVPSLELADGATFQAGRTVLRARSAAAVVPPAVPLEEAPGERRWFRGPRGALLAWACFFVAVALNKHFGEYRETSPSRLAGAWIVLFTGLAAAGAAWAGLWALLGRVIAGRRAFWSHAAAAGTGVFLFAAATSLYDWADFALGLPGRTGILWWVLTGLVLAGVLRAHLRPVLAGSPRRAAVLSAAVAAVLWGLAGAASYFFGQKFSPAPRFDDGIKPAWARLARPDAPEAWLAKLPKLHAAADERAK